MRLQRDREKVVRVGKAALSLKQLIVVWLNVGGLSLRDISRLMCLPVPTVQSIKRRVCGRVGMSTSADLIRWAIRTGVIKP